MRNFEWIRLNRTGFVILVGVSIIVMGLWASNHLQKAKRRLMADELGNVGDIWGLPKANQANTKFAFAQRSENGLGLYECSLERPPRMVTETWQGTFNPAIFRVLDWTPDGQSLACTCDGRMRTYDPESRESTDEIIIGGGLVNFAWLSPTRIAAFDQLKLYDVVLVNHHWQKRLCYLATNAHSITSGMALSDHSFVWRRDNEIWLYDFTTALATKLWGKENHRLIDFSFSERHQRIYVNCGTNGGSLYASITRSTNTEFEPVAKIGRSDQYILKVSRLNEGYSYLASNTQEQDIRPASPAKNKTLYVLKNPQAEPVRLLGEREVVDYGVSGNSLLIIGSMTNEPCGIWVYDFSSATLKNVWCPLGSPKYSTLVTPEYHTITNGDRGQLHYYLWPPVKRRAAGKNPLMICQSNYRWMAEAQVAANSGCYFAMAERPTFHSGEMNSWPSDVSAVYEEIVKSGMINTNRVYLFGTSAETGYVNELLSENPQTWKGAFLEGGTGPKSSASSDHPPELAVILGNHDEFNPLKSIIAYKEAAAKNGLAVKVVIRRGVHTALASSTQREIARLLADFLHDN